MAEPESAVIVPLLNGGEQWKGCLRAIREQDRFSGPIIVIDSSSTDGSADIAREAGCIVETIPRSSFNHGATRQMAIDKYAPNASIVVFLTQDAILAESTALARLIDEFRNPEVGAAYGRQLPHNDATPIAAHARIFNYPSTARLKSAADIPDMGIKAAFLSNSFSAYRRSALLSVGGFPVHTRVNEDLHAAARLLLEGWSVAYCADARVYHSHNYSIAGECRRYYEIGAFLGSESWVSEKFGKVEGEGLHFVKSELHYLWNGARWLIPAALCRNALKYGAYRLGMKSALKANRRRQ